ncbi:PHP domain-containing protein [Catenulispora yoronensis]|uniref:PHP domain-containing protein n=1 Tax=Catenulispora yoronensis TaxID=450799 RepID=A0ABN2UGE9_9ACTN
MGIGHGHHHHHDHDHEHSQESPADIAHLLDTAVADADLSPADVSRRGVLRSAGVIGAGVAAAGVLGAGAAAAHDSGDDERGASADRSRRSDGDYLWLAGDHHIHTQYSSDGQYRVIDHVRHANAFGLGWMVITDHGSAQHAKIGVEKVNPDIRAARAAVDGTLVFQGLEWNIPAAEHGTVFVHPGDNEVAVLKEFENSFDGVVQNATASTPANEALALAGVNYLADAVTRKRVRDALFLANHPARKGLDSPHEIRGWRDAAPNIAVGFEGAPGHQAAGLPAPTGPGSGRGFYDNSPSASSFPAYPLESYRTFGGFDWMTATVGGLWDSLLAEGKPWWITANSDSHQVYADTSVRGAGTDFNTNGFHNPPEHGGTPDLTLGDFWPGFYSRTHVGASSYNYAAVMNALRAGRVWVDHGRLIDGLDVRARVRGQNRGVTLGGVLTVKRGSRVQLAIDVDLAAGPNWAQFVAKLARVDVVQGDVTGAVSDRDVFKSPNTRVVKSFEITQTSGRVSLVYDLGAVDRPVYLRVRGTDGKRTGAGALGAAIDPNGPQMDVLGSADPWKDLWFYANPIWVLPS